MKKESIANKYEFGAFLVSHWTKAIAILLTIGIVGFILQIKSLKIGDLQLEKQAIKATKLKK